MSTSGLCLNQEEQLKGKVLKLNTTLTRLNAWWKHKAKIYWINEGDDNTHFFHSIASACHRSNRICTIKLEDKSLIEDGRLIKECFVNFFKDKWRERVVDLNNKPLNGLRNKVNDNVHCLLNVEVTNTEIWDAICCMGFNRSPVIDGITASFYKNFWHIVGQSVREAIKDFFRSSVMPKGWKQTLIVLIPKGGESNNPSKFRLISLCCIIYKITDKILVNRFKNVMFSIISKE